MVKSVEALSSGGAPLCKMPDLPDVRKRHTTDGNLSCGGYVTKTSCIRYGEGGWSKYNNLQQLRDGHVSWQRPNDGGVQLFGGRSSPRTSEIVTRTGSHKGFDLKYDTILACGIQHDNVLIITGGTRNYATVSKYNIEGWVSDLPNLKSGRSNHGCAHYYSNSNELIYLVTGGFDGRKRLSSTEIFSETNYWSYVGELPGRIGGGNFWNGRFNKKHLDETHVSCINHQAYLFRDPMYLTCFHPTNLQ